MSIEITGHSTLQWDKVLKVQLRIPVGLTTYACIAGKAGLSGPAIWCHMHINKVNYMPLRTP